MYVKPPENIQQPQQPRRIARRGDSTFQDELIERLTAADVVDSVHLSDENEKKSKQQQESEDKKRKQKGVGLGKLDIEA